jgi:uncharacterized protein YwgA
VNDVELILLTLYHHDNHVNGRKRLQKIICVLKNKYNIQFSYNFKPYYYGPYSESLSNALDVLVSSDMIEEEVEVIDEYDEIYQYVYKLKQNGKDIIKTIITQNKEMSKKLETAINEIKGLDTKKLVYLSKEVSNLYNM